MSEQDSIFIELRVKGRTYSARRLLRHGLSLTELAGRVRSEVSLLLVTVRIATAKEGEL